MRRLWRKPTVVGFLAVGMAIAISGFMGGVSLLAQVATNSTEDGLSMKKQATVIELLNNEHGDIDGLKLDGDVRVHFPPHMGEQISAIAKVGDRVTVEGRSEVTPRGEKVFEITQITSGKDTVRIVHPGPKHGPKSKQDEPPMSATAQVTEYATNPHGDVDGLILKGGTIVKFPPHQSDELQDVVKIGDEVTIEGRRHVTPHGEVHLHADTIRTEDKSIRREGWKHGPKPSHAPRAGDPEEPTNAEILKELREIRKLLSERR